MRYPGRTVVVMLGLLMAGWAGATDGIIFSDVTESAVTDLAGGHLIMPYRVLAVDFGALAEILAAAPEHRSAAVDVVPVHLGLPLPNREQAVFSIERSPVMAPALAARFPEINTYRGRTEDPKQPGTLRLDLTPAGFHAIIFSPEGTVLIDPLTTADPVHHVSYYLEHQRPSEPSWCEQAGPHPAQARTGRLTSSGSELRTYRLAVAATGEYTAFHGGTVSQAMAAITTVINRVNGIFEKEVAVHFDLVADNDQIIYTDPDSDPYGDDAFAMRLENQSNLDATIGNANYDVGQVFYRGSTSLAEVGVVCAQGFKARGVSGRPAPISDPFAIDRVAHQLGHQLGAYHTFNGSTGQCHYYRSGPNAYEPASGSTIMAFAGKCGVEDLQNNASTYFHTISFERIVDFTTQGQGDTCAAITNTQNSAPQVNAGQDYEIPASTPFTLTGSAIDPDGDPLTFCWEQFDLGPSSPPNTDDGLRPIMRSFDPVASPSRTFPQLADILANSETLGESLPSTDRVLNFRFTARDDQQGGGGVDQDAMTILVHASAGPFVITAPDSAATWGTGGLFDVIWDVAGTNQAPINCSQVRILLSEDSGLSFPYTLAAATANDGYHAVGPSGTGTQAARIKIECVGNIFFDISDGDFTITHDLSHIFSDDYETGDTTAWSSTGNHPEQ